MALSRRDGVATYYEVAGAGPPLVLVHANPFDRRLFLFQVASFAQHYRVITVDMRGYGNSDKPETPFTLRDMADDVLAVCDREGVDRAIFGGVSTGSGISMLIGLDQPERVEALVLVGGSARGAANPDAQVAGWSGPDFPRFYQESLLSLFAPHFPETPLGRWVVDLYLATVPSLSGKSIAQIFRARGDCDMTARLPSLRPPTLIVNGAHDVSLTDGYESARLVPHARHVVLPGTGHACNIEDPAAFDAAVLAFLSGLRL